jgi:hypothetical protein
MFNATVKNISVFVVVIVLLMEERKPLAFYLPNTDCLPLVMVSMLAKSVVDL